MTKAMRVRWVCVAAAVGLYLDSRSAMPQVTTSADEHVDRIVGMAMARGGAHAFLQRLTDSIGGRVTGSSESGATAELLISTLREAGFDNARFEGYALESRWQRGRAVGRVVSPVVRPLAVGSYGWVPGTKGEVTAPLIDLGAPPTDLLGPTDRFRGAAVIVEPQAVEGAPSQVSRATLARGLAQAGAAAMFIPSDKPNGMLYTSAFGFYPRGPLPVLSVAREDVLFLRRLLADGPVRVSLDVADTIDASPAQERELGREVASSCFLTHTINGGAGWYAESSVAFPQTWSASFSSGNDVFSLRCDGRSGSSIPQTFFVVH